MPKIGQSAHKDIMALRCRHKANAVGGRERPRRHKRASKDRFSLNYRQ